MNDAEIQRIQPRVHRGVRIGLGPTVHCALIATVAFFFVPFREILIRWRRTVPNLAALGLYTVVFYTFAASWVVAFVIAAVALLLVFTAVTAGLIRWRTDDMWHVRDGADGAVILTQWVSRHDRQELHTWATFRHRRGLGRAVLDAALTDAPRPLWLNPAISSLREFYLSKGAVPDPDGSRWLVLLEG